MARNGHCTHILDYNSGNMVEVKVDGRGNMVEVEVDGRGNMVEVEVDGRGNMVEVDGRDSCCVLNEQQKSFTSNTYSYN